MTGNFNTTEARALVERLTGFTPGPWTWEIESGEWPDHQIIGGDGDSVLWWDFDLGFRTACDGCARLIAAAPDLHAALTAALDEIERLETQIRSLDHALNFILSDAAWTPKHPACESIIARINALRKGDDQ